MHSLPLLQSLPLKISPKSTPVFKPTLSIKHLTLKCCISDGDSNEPSLSGDAVSGMVNELLKREENRELLNGLEEASRRVDRAREALADIERQEVEALRAKEYVSQLENRKLEVHMDYGGRYSGSNATEIIPDASNTGGNEAWMPPSNDQSIWATEDDYRVWNTDPASDSISNSTQSRAGSEQPPSKKNRGSSQNDAQLSGSSSKSKAIGKMFFKTKLCCKFCAGTCPYITTCNFAHGMEELRPPPPNWQEIAAANDEASEPREEHQIPILTSSTLMGEGQRSYKRRHCRKFYTEEGCPYGDMCTFLHDEQSKARESVAIILSPTVGGGGYGAGANGSNLKPSNWKTRICNKWELTNYCPFGSKCHFAHGAAELHRYGGGLVGTDGRDAASAVTGSKQAVASSKAHTDVIVAVSQRQGQRPLQKWKGPDKISRIYGDWIDDIE